MKILSFEDAAGRQRFGAVLGDAVVDLTGRLGDGIDTLRSALEAGVLGRAAAIIDRGGADLPLAGLRFIAPVPFPEKIICIGVNYGNRNAEYKDGSEQPKYPSMFFRTPGSLVGMYIALTLSPAISKLPTLGPAIISEMPVVEENWPTIWTVFSLEQKVADTTDL